MYKQSGTAIEEYTDDNSYQSKRHNVYHIRGVVHYKRRTTCYQKNHKYDKQRVFQPNKLRSEQNNIYHEQRQQTCYHKYIG